MILNLCSNSARKLFECFREQVISVTLRWTTRDLSLGEASVCLCLLLIFPIVMMGIGL